MSKIIFRENYDEYDDKVIEAGRWWEISDDKKLFVSKLNIFPTDKEVRTDCGDSYMDYSISFDDFLAVADKIRELSNEK